VFCLNAVPDLGEGAIAPGIHMQGGTHTSSGSVHILRHQGGGGGQGSNDEGVHGCDDVINIFAQAVILPASIVTITHLVVS